MTRNWCRESLSLWKTELNVPNAGIHLCLGTDNGKSVEICCPRPFLKESFEKYRSYPELRKKYKISRDDNNNVLFFSEGKEVAKPKDIMEQILRGVREQCVQKSPSFDMPNNEPLIGIPSNLSDPEYFMSIVKSTFPNAYGLNESVLAVMGYRYLNGEQSEERMQYYVFTIHELGSYATLVTREREKESVVYSVKHLSLQSGINKLRSDSSSMALKLSKQAKSGKMQVLILVEGASDIPQRIEKVCRANNITAYIETEKDHLIAVGAAIWNGEKIEQENSSECIPQFNCGIYCCGQKIPFFTANQVAMRVVKKQFKNGGAFHQIDFCVYYNDDLVEYCVTNLRGNEGERFEIAMTYCGDKKQPIISASPSVVSRANRYELSCHKLYTEDESLNS